VEFLNKYYIFILIFSHLIVVRAAEGMDTGSIGWDSPLAYGIADILLGLGLGMAPVGPSLVLKKRKKMMLFKLMKIFIVFKLKINYFILISNFIYINLLC
jgi:hypothetical protein